jgi:PKD repeat protein
LTVNFTSAAVDADGIVASYKWDFGDGKISDQPNTSHTYSEEGNYLVRLEVVDDKGGKAEKSMTISVSAPPPPPPPAPEPPPLLPTDTDQDGLSDLEELQIGTNPRMIDTDLDGLDDYAEVKVYKSDPTKRDTDGDGYDDGLEVKSGYSPVGKGKL